MTKSAATQVIARTPAVDIISQPGFEASEIFDPILVFDFQSPLESNEEHMSLPRGQQIIAACQKVISRHVPNAPEAFVGDFAEDRSLDSERVVEGFFEESLIIEFVFRFVVLRDFRSQYLEDLLICLSHNTSTFTGRTDLNGTPGKPSVSGYQSQVSRVNNNGRPTRLFYKPARCEVSLL